MSAFNPGSKVGVWTAYLFQRSFRQVEFRLVRRSHNTESLAVSSKDPISGATRISPVVDHEVAPFVFRPLDDGTFYEDSPAFKSSLEGPIAGDTIDLIQAIVNEAAKCGIVPQQQQKPDRSEEIKRLEYHLRDMRHLAFKGKAP